jgi:hypothetical protein
MDSAKVLTQRTDHSEKYYVLSYVLVKDFYEADSSSEQASMIGWFMKDNLELLNIWKEATVT